MCSLKFSLVVGLLLVSQNQIFGQLVGLSSSAESNSYSDSSSISSSEEGLSKANGYLPPIGSAPSEDVPAFAKPPQKPNDQGKDDAPTDQQPAFVVQPQNGCAAALLCVAEDYCTITGDISDTPVRLTESQKLRQVPMVDCRNPDTGIIGKCCRDTNYVDPWPAGGNLPPNYKGGFDENGFPKTLKGSYKTTTPRPVPIGSQIQPNVPSPSGPGFVAQRPSTPRPFIPQEQFPQASIDSDESVAGPSSFESQKIGQPSLVPSQSLDQGAFVPPQRQGQPGALQKPGPFVPPYPQQPAQTQQPSGLYPSSTLPPASIQPQFSSGYPSSTYAPSTAQPQQPSRPFGSSTYAPPTIHSSTIGYPSTPYPQSSGSYSTGRPIVVAPLPQPGKGFEVPHYPEVPNQIPSLTPAQQIYGNGQGPAAIPAQPQELPYPGYPSFSAPAVTKGPQGSYPADLVPVSIAQHYPGQKCGIINQVQHPGGLRDSEAAFGEIPWEAMILFNPEKKLLCSGSIVAPTKIVTTASCVYKMNPHDVSIKAGEYKLGYDLKHEEPYPFEIVGVAGIDTHPGYQVGNNAYDLAVLHLEHPIKLDQHVDTICIPDQVVNVTPGRKCISVGWGKEVLAKHLAGATQNKIDVQVLGKNECRQRLAGAETPLDLHDSHICGKPLKQSNNMCMVDLGGPLACQRQDGSYELVGVYSQDTGCLPTNQVASFAVIDVDWVNQMIQEPSLLPPFSPDVHHVGSPSADQPLISSSPSPYPGSPDGALNQYLPPS